jgi:TonB-linked SusC/RagA family outer membrane protein
MKKKLRFMYFMRSERLLKGLIMPKFILFLVIISSLQCFAKDNNTTIIRKGRSNALSVIVKGRVTDDADQALIGVSVKVKGLDLGTQTDVNGNFTLTVPDADVSLVFSYTGYETQEVPASGKSNINIKLKAANNSLNEVIVVGYGVVKKSSLTGAVTKISNEALNTLPTSNAIDALQGKIPGVVIGAETTPGSTPSILIRGTRSITAGNNPLYVVDGVPLSPGSTISDISTTDIESIEVLKDAASAAIFGSRGANGVIMVTTKRGRPNQPLEVTFSTYAGVNDPQIPKLMNGPQYVQLRRDVARANQNGGWGTSYPSDAVIFVPAETPTIAAGNFVDWQKLLFRNGTNQSYNASVSHGSDKSQVFFSLGYVDQQGYYKNSENQRINAALNADFNVSKIVKVGISTRISNSESFNANQNGALPLAYMNPLAQPFDANGNLINLPSAKNGNIWNPLANYYYPYKNTNNNLRVNNVAYVNLSLFKGLSFRSNFSLNVSRSSTDIFLGTLSYDEAGRTNHAEQNNSITNDMVWDNILTYIRDFGPHSINFTAVSSFQSSTNTSENASGEGFPIEDINSYNLNTATANIVIGSGYTKTAIESYVGRLQYAFKDKYIVNGSFRADGSSVLAQGHQWGYFPSVSAAWVVSKESFFKSDLVSNLKLRGSYGTVGNSAIGAYSTIGLAQQRPYDFGTVNLYGYKLGGPINSDLKWESSTTANIGIEVSAFKNRVTATLELYNTKTSDLLLNRNLPTLSGFGVILQNIGQTNNKGIELGVTAHTISSKTFNWNTDFNLYFNKNAIDKLITNANLPANALFIGQPVNVYYDYQKTGIWQTSEAADAAKFQRVPGDVKIKDQNGDGVVEAVNDKVVLGQVQPKVSLFMRNSFDYKKFNVAFALESKLGQMVTSNALGGDDFYDGQRNLPASIAGHYWTPDNPTNDYPRVGPSQPLNYTLTGYRKGSYINMQEISLGYNFSQLKIFKSFQLYARAKNPFYVWRADKNIDPQAPGFDVSAFRSYVVGLNVKL